MFAWTVILDIVGRFSEAALFTEEETEAQHVLANLRAGPLENLLSRHGADFITVVEDELSATAGSFGRWPAFGRTR